MDTTTQTRNLSGHAKSLSPRGYKAPPTPAVANRSILARVFWASAGFVARQGVWVLIGFLIVPAKPGSVNYRAGLSKIGFHLKAVGSSTAVLVGAHIRSKTLEAKQNYASILEEDNSPDNSAHVISQ